MWVLRAGEAPLRYIYCQHSKRNNTGFVALSSTQTGTPTLKKLVWDDTYWLNKMLYWGHMPNLCRMESMWVWISKPPISTVPEVGGKRPVSIDLRKQNENIPTLLFPCHIRKMHCTIPLDGAWWLLTMGLDGTTPVKKHTYIQILLPCYTENLVNLQIRMLLLWVKHTYCGTITKKKKRQFKVHLK